MGVCVCVMDNLPFITNVRCEWFVMHSLQQNLFQLEAGFGVQVLGLM